MNTNEIHTALDQIQHRADLLYEAAVTRTRGRARWRQRRRHAREDSERIDRLVNEIRLALAERPAESATSPIMLGGERDEYGWSY